MFADTINRHFSEDLHVDSPADELRAGATIDIGHCGICGKPATVELADEHTIVETMRHSPECPMAKPMLNLYDTPDCVVSYDTHSLCASGTVDDAYLRLYELNEPSRRRKPLWEDGTGRPDDEPHLDEQYYECDQYGDIVAYSPGTSDEEPSDYDELDSIDFNLD
jgi:hypothetical protein